MAGPIDPKNQKENIAFWKHLFSNVQDKASMGSNPIEKLKNGIIEYKILTEKGGIPPDAIKREVKEFISGILDLSNPLKGLDSIHSAIETLTSDQISNKLSTVSSIINILEQ